MGNAVPRIRHDEATAQRSGATTPAAAGRTARRHGGKVERDADRRPRRAVDDEQKAGGGGVAMTVKMVMTRKEAARLIARLEEHNAKERKARIAEITRRLRAGRDSGGQSPPSCGAAWRPRLTPIQEI